MRWLTQSMKGAEKDAGRLDRGFFFSLSPIVPFILFDICMMED